MATPSTRDTSQPAPGVDPGSQARQPHHRQLSQRRSAEVPGTSSAVSLEDARAWIRENQSLAVAGAFVAGLFIGINMRG